MGFVKILSEDIIMITCVKKHRVVNTVKTLNLKAITFHCAATFVSFFSKWIWVCLEIHHTFSPPPVSAAKTLIAGTHGNKEIAMGITWETAGSEYRATFSVYTYRQAQLHCLSPLFTLTLYHVPHWLTSTATWKAETKTQTPSLLTRFTQLQLVGLGGRTRAHAHNTPFTIAEMSLTHSAYENKMDT